MMAADINATLARLSEKHGKKPRTPPPPLEPWEGIDSPNFTQFPHALLRDAMRLVSGDEFKLLAVVVDETFGFRRHGVFVPISHAEFVRKSGVAPRTAARALARLLAAGYLEKQRRKDAAVGDQATGYRLRLRD